MKWEGDRYVKPTAFKHIVLCSLDLSYNNSCLEKVSSLCSNNEQRVEHYVLLDSYNSRVLHNTNTYDKHICKSDEYHQITVLFSSLSKTLWLSGQELLFLRHSSETILGQFRPTNGQYEL